MATPAGPADSRTRTKNRKLSDVDSYQNLFAGWEIYGFAGCWFCNSFLVEINLHWLHECDQDDRQCGYQGDHDVAIAIRQRIRL